MDLDMIQITVRSGIKMEYNFYKTRVVIELFLQCKSIRGVVTYSQRMAGSWYGF